MAVMLFLFAALMIWPTVITLAMGGWDWVIELYAILIASVAGAGVLFCIGWLVTYAIEYMNRLEKLYIKETSDEKFVFDTRRH